MSMNLLHLRMTIMIIAITTGWRRRDNQQGQLVIQCTGWYWQANDYLWMRGGGGANDGKDNSKMREHANGRRRRWQEEETWDGEQTDIHGQGEEDVPMTTKTTTR
jgi:hypothetical protein